MGMFDFIKEAGEKLFGKGEAKAAQDAAVAEPTANDKSEAANRAAGYAIEAYIAKMGLTATGLTVTVDGAQGKVTVFGVAPDQATREKIILCCGNVEGVESVEDKMSVNVETAESQWHTVVKGDTLWAIAQVAYGNGAEYNKIFEANKPMLTHPDKIYPGQKLRIPPK
ncbi:peptidoglycan-binding protein LysM [Cupriavidus pauculus]|uniref:peptidoglycan-binding protein LysM n=1 Tax=Cupriavidus pauculus TaxID=82633 RepID=UPI0012486CC6|nr:peptidoglycan-binding protein LysM [Cupriavidus pauculus]KAB0604565.1 peptidoglycan-binding protein LysM [Cupriavidus pauculus]MCM3606985.1 peptidoglycan-binding protein LysM [Cupriavidus pauculus]UAK99000.1 peptidoglycan-binding protein LysM [Cupriavidus pauculus]